jgi:membrane-bound lytic murein transglycosylase B
LKDFLLLRQFAWLLVCFLLPLGSVKAELPDNLPDFPTWLDGLRQEALSAGIRPELLDEVLTGVEPDMKVLDRDRNQPEVKQTFEGYSSARLSDARITTGRQRLLQYKPLLAKVEKAYGVPAPMIVAVWGLESNYGSLTGGKEVVPALLTLAYDPRRSGYFRKELINALKILNDGNIPPHLMTGSWAGAMGQSQFMPSSYLAFAQDFSGDGHKDIWSSEADVFASIAFFIKEHGWQAHGLWGRPVKLPDDIDKKLYEKNIGPPANSCALRNHTGFLTLTKWRALGVRLADGKRLPKSKIQASLVRPDGPDGAAYLAYMNYRSILKYNCSDYYALTVGLLADAINAKK